MPAQNYVAQWLIQDYGPIQAEMIAEANIRIGDGAPGYWEEIRNAIREAQQCSQLS